MLPPVIRARAEHVVYETERVKLAESAMRAGDMEELGKLLNSSHASLKNLYEVTGKELDALAAAAQSHPACYGSRMTGAGFGGCTVSIVKKAGAEDFKKYVSERYFKETGYVCECYDAEIADILRRSGKPVVLAVNKVDTGDRMADAYQFYSLGLGEELFCIASATGSGTGDLLDEIVKKLPPDSGADDDHPELPHIAIVGKPNVGKSSLTNALLGTERNIVTPVAGTTRDSISTYYNKFGHQFMLVDTAGMRKKSKVHEDLEFYSVMRSIRAIEHSDVCILMIDAQTGLEAQDMSIFNLIARNRKGCVIVVNKWDLIEKDTNTMRQYTEALKARLAPFNDIPLIFTSVINKQRILDVLNAAGEVYNNYSKKIPTSTLNEEMLPEIENFPPPAWKGKYVKIKYATQLPTRFPAFAFFCNLPQYVKDPYKRFLENRLREKFGFSGCPVQIYIRKK